MTPSTLRDHFEVAISFPEFLERARANETLWRDAYRLARVPDGAAARLAALPGTWRLLVIAEDWCGDAVNTVPVIARLAELAPNVELRIIGRDDYPALIDAHLTNGSRSIPLVILLHEDFEERGRWGPRPTALQRWVLDEGLALEKEERYRRVRGWYARDRGRTTVDEVVSVIACAADPLCVERAA
jgi:hypothetical protein